ncbi:MAG: hypothetical protein WDO72_12805 [Pseudomonadota bacterium]
MATRFFTQHVAIAAPELFTAAVWVLRSLAVGASLFVALRVASWVI